MSKDPLAHRIDASKNILEIVQHCTNCSQRIYIVDIAAILDEARELAPDHVGFSVFLKGQIAQLNETEFACSVATPHPITPLQSVIEEASKSKLDSEAGPSESKS